MQKQPVVGIVYACIIISFGMVCLYFSLAGLAVHYRNASHSECTQPKGSQ